MPAKRKITYYDILVVARDASLDQIRKAYRANAMKLHPDRNKAPNAHRRFIQLRQAYEVLSNPARRSRYDEKLRGLEGDVHGSDPRVSDPHEFDDFANPGPPIYAQPFQRSETDDPNPEIDYSDPIEDAINIYTMSWRDFSSYPTSIKVRKILLTFCFRLFFAFVGAFLALLFITVWFWSFRGMSVLPLMVEVYKYPIYFLSAYFLIFGRPIVFHYARKWFGWDNDI